MNRKVFASLLLACGIMLPSALLPAADPVVSNVRAVQRTDGSKLVDIWYNVTDADGDRQNVSVAVSVNGVPVGASSFSGHVGPTVTPGSNRRIVWDAGSDWNGQFSSAVKFTVTADDFGMVLIPGGTNAGTNPLADAETYGDWYPATYSLTVEAFYMDRYEVTKAKWDEVYIWAITHGYSFDNDVHGEGPHGQGKAANHPVQTVNWYDCVKWCNARSEKEGRTPCYTVGGAVYKTGSFGWDDGVVNCIFSATGYRLPTETEWEYAARGGLANRRFMWGDRIDHTRANYYAISRFPYDDGYEGFDTRYAIGDYPYTSPVGSFAANGYGLYDMAGNVWGWCNDWDPSWGGSGRVLRGSSWDNDAPHCRVGSRIACGPPEAPIYFGFRAVLPSGQQ